MSRKWSFFIGLVLIGAGIGFWAMVLRSPVKPNLNLILITLDTTRADHLGCYGYKDALTPTLDKLARQGVVFERAYTPAPFTLPAHASMHTGLYPYQHGLFNNGMNALNLKLPTLAESLAHAGYATGAFVASYVLESQFGLNRGFSIYDDVMPPKEKDGHGYPQRRANHVVDTALLWLNQHVEHPFFCWMHFYDPHFEYVDHSDTLGDRFKEHPYDGEIAFVDQQLQRVIDFLESQHLTDRTLIVIAGDHGEGLGEHLERWHGNMIYNSTLHVPLIVSLPSQLSQSKRVSTPVSIVDIGKTAFDCLGVTPPAGFGGRSLKPALLGQSISAGEYYGESDNAYVEEGWSPLRCLITEEWKYIQTTKPELYNLKDDPGELTNVIDSKPDLAQEMDQRLRDMEAQGIRHESQAKELSHREQKVLASLGYLNVQKAKTEVDSDENLPDIKDSAALVYAFQVIQELYWRQQKDVALARLQELVESAPHYLAPRLMVGRVLETDGKLDEAKQYLEGMLQFDPENKEANARIGRIIAKQGDYQKALPYHQKALERDAKGNRATLAVEALPYLLEALKKEPNSIDLHYLVAKMLRIKGRNGEAMVHMHQAEVAALRQDSQRRTDQ
jgi:arylsulfatase A-like enzyme